MIMLFDQEYAVEQYGNARAKEAREKGREEGREKGREEGMLKTFFNLVRKGILTVSIAAKEAGMKEEDFQTLLNQQKTEEAEQEKGTP